MVNNCFKSAYKRQKEGTLNGYSKISGKRAAQEEIERQLMDLDSEFRFKCRKMRDKCCMSIRTILFNTRDIFNIAH